MHQGDFGSSMFGILHGRASVTFVDRLDRANAVTTVAAGEVVGEMAMLTGDRRSATVTAVTDVDAVEITRSALEKLFVEAPELMDAFAASLARRKAQLDQLTAAPANTAGWNIIGRVRKLLGASHQAARRCGR